MKKYGTGFMSGWIFLLIFSLLVSFCWYMSPLGIGFNYNPHMSATQKKVGETIYSLSYFFGIPALLGTQVISGIIGFRGKPRQAIKLSLLSIFIFIGLVITSLIILT